MKKRLLILMLFIMPFMLTSCLVRKNSSYRYVGAYVEIVKFDNKDINDRNIKLFYNIDSKSVIEKNGIWEYQIASSQINKSVTDECNIDISIFYTITCNYIDAQNLNEVKVYPIIYKDKKYQILEEESKTIKLKTDSNEGITITEQYIFNKQNYNFKVGIKILKKEG